MRAIQITNEDGPDKALEVVELPEPEPSHMLTPGEGVLVEVHAAGVSFPELLQTRGEYQMKPPLPYVPGSEVGGVVISAPGRRRREGRRPCRGVLRARRLGRDGGRARVLHLPADRRARLRAGRRAGPQLPHRLLLAAPARAPERGRDGAGARRRRRRRHGLAAGRARARREDDRGRLERGEEEGRRRSGSRPRRDGRRRLEGRGPRAVRGRRRARARPRRRRPLPRQPALAARGRPAGRGRASPAARSRRCG